MNLVELNRALRQLRLGSMAAVLETRLRQAQAESMAPLRPDLPAWSPMNSPAAPTCMLERRRKQAEFRDPSGPSTSSISTSTRR